MKFTSSFTSHSFISIGVKMDRFPMASPEAKRLMSSSAWPSASTTWSGMKMSVASRFGFQVSEGAPYDSDRDEAGYNFILKL